MFFIGFFALDIHKIAPSYISAKNVVKLMKQKFEYLVLTTIETLQMVRFCFVRREMASNDVSFL
jgi:hypothetical protein